VKIARVLNVVAIAALVGSAVWVYRIKYEATLHAEHAQKLKREITLETDAIATLRAEWAYLARPDRVQDFAKQHLDLAPLGREQTVMLASLPSRPAPVDEIGKKLEALGLMGEDASIAVDAPSSGPAPAKKPQQPAKKATIAVKPAAQLQAPASRPASKPLSTPKPSQPLNIADFLKKMGLAQ
jgi:cell division protein FtsL